MMHVKPKPPLRAGSPDDFQTPAIAIDPLLKFIPRDKVIWEPACGKGNLVKEFERQGYKVIGTDVLYGQNFLNYEAKGYDIIVTNPPYSIKEKFLSRCYELCMPFALLMPLTGLESEKRQKLYRKHGIQLIIPNKRINFETPSGKGNGSWFMTCWYTNGLRLERDLTFIKLPTTASSPNMNQSTLEI